MKNQVRMEDAAYDDLPLFRVIGPRHVWGNLPTQSQQEVVALLSELLRSHVVSKPGEEKDNE